MAASDRMAVNMGWSAFSKASDLKKRLWFTIGCLIVYRLGTYIPLPGIDTEVFAQFFQQFTQSGGMISLLNAFAGGAVERMSIFALNLMPYISAAIIMQLMQAVSPRLEALKKEGDAGRKKINQYTRYLTVLLAALQAYGIAVSVEGLQTQNGPAVSDPGLFFRASVVITLVGGTLLLMWIGEQITARGIGNGISLLIFAGIVATAPLSIAQLLDQGRDSGNYLLVIGVLASTVGLIGVIVYAELAYRRIIVQYPKRQQGNKMTGGESSHIPLKLNTAGVIPAIFASSLLFIPQTITNFSGNQPPEWVQFIAPLIGSGSVGFFLLFAALIAFFTFFYVAIVFNPAETADNLRKYGGFVPGIRPGKPTADYLDFVLTRITVVGAIYLVVVCVVPEIMRSRLGLAYTLGGTSLLIMVSVTIDTMRQVQGHLLAHQYEGLIKKSRLRGGKRK
jgi:preprotein translocase subunit SecY